MASVFISEIPASWRKGRQEQASVNLMGFLEQRDGRSHDKNNTCLRTSSLFQEIVKVAAFLVKFLCGLSVIHLLYLWINT